MQRRPATIDSEAFAFQPVATLGLRAALYKGDHTNWLHGDVSEDPVVHDAAVDQMSMAGFLERLPASTARKSEVFSGGSRTTQSMLKHTQQLPDLAAQPRGGDPRWTRPAGHLSEHSAADGASEHTAYTAMSSNTI